MKRLALLVVVLASLCACGSSHRSVHQLGSNVIDYRPNVAPSSVTALANERERAAGRSAAALLKSVPLPPGAVRLPTPAPTSPLAQSGLGVSTVVMTADRFSLWRVPGTRHAFIAFEKRHLLPALRAQGLGSAPNGWTGYEVDGPIVNGSARWAISVQVMPDGGSTRVRFDAGSAWVYPRSLSEVLPAGVTEVDVHGAGVDRRVTNPAQVGRIVRWFDALNVAQPGPMVGCVAIIDSTVTFVFRSSSHAPLATAYVPTAGPTTNCNSIRFSIRGKEQTPLIDNLVANGHYFADRVQRLLGVRFSRPQL